MRLMSGFKIAKKTYQVNNSKLTTWRSTAPSCAFTVTLVEQVLFTLWRSIASYATEKGKQKMPNKNRKTQRTNLTNPPYLGGEFSELALSLKSGRRSNAGIATDEWLQNSQKDVPSEPSYPLDNVTSKLSKLFFYHHQTILKWIYS